eukprot:SAG22_NODE_4025_length_1417_cov_1.836874_3_plen_81_part_00
MGEGSEHSNTIPGQRSDLEKPGQRKAAHAFTLEHTRTCGAKLSPAAAASPWLVPSVTISDKRFKAKAVRFGRRTGGRLSF